VINLGGLAVLATLLRSLRVAAVGVLLIPGVAAAVSSPIASGGLAESFACTSGSILCEFSADFSLDPPTPVKPVSGAIDFTPSQAGATSVDITLSNLDFTMTGSSGAIARIDFTGVTLTVTGMSVTAGPGVGTDIGINGSVVSGAISGTYVQRDGGGAVVVAAQPFSDLSVSIDNFACGLTNSGVGTCGFDLGLSDRFDLDVDGAPHWVVQTYNVNVVPEPTTAVLLGLGLAGLAWGRRR
jgi:hypothetical protein